MPLLRRFLNVFRPGRLNREFDEELEFHRQMRLRKAANKGSIRRKRHRRPNVAWAVIR